ncbi:MAG: PGDYG domain-containing protein [Eudoraea sp.]|nr:PGDYG domain-containing protein [Eudoraea sp.]
MLEFKANKIPELDFQEAIKKPIRVKCFQMQQPFKVETMEGTLEGKAGDWLMVGIHGEMYPIDQEIFQQTYTLCDKD